MLTNLWVCQSPGTEICRPGFPHIKDKKFARACGHMRVEMETHAIRIDRPDAHADSPDPRSRYRRVDLEGF